jgi:hypothetical protein
MSADFCRESRHATSFEHDEDTRHGGGLATIRGGLLAKDLHRYARVEIE